MTTADTLFVNGNIATVDKDFTFVHAVAVKNGWIIDTGETAEMRALYEGAGTQVVDLEGRTMLPGIHDAHTHICDWSDNARNTVDCSGFSVRSLDDLKVALRKRAGEIAPGAWVRGAGMNCDDIAELHAEGRYITRWDLDEILPDVPVVIIFWDGHTCAANSKVLELNGIDENTPDPLGGEIIRDANGKPTGVFQESSALQLVFRNMPRASVDELKQNLINGQKIMNSMGYASYCDCTTGPANTTREVGASGENGLRAYEELLNEGALTARVSLGFYPGKNGMQSYELIKESLDTFEMPVYADKNWVDMHMLKMFCDGVHMGYSAWMKEDYADNPGCHGRSTFLGPDATDEEQIAEINRCVQLAHDRGWQIGIHTIGDKAVQVVTDAYIAAQRNNPMPLRRHYLIHADNLGDHDDLFRAMKNGIGVSVQTNLQSFVYEVSIERCGKRKGEMLMGMRDLIDAGMHIANGSDSIGGPYGCWTQAVQAAVTRKSGITGQVYRPDMRATVPQIIRQFTYEGAYQEFAEDTRGTIEPNKKADFCVLDKNIFTIDHDAITECKCVMTVVDGKIVYEA